MLLIPLMLVTTEHFTLIGLLNHYPVAVTQPRPSVIPTQPTPTHQVSLFIVTGTKAPGGTRCSVGTKDLGETIGKDVAIVDQKIVCSIPTSVLSGTLHDAMET